ncbi:hypothetical protein B296_00008171 [Ensete ventricosum]|uniref:Vesicle-fusing ATPase n=1 Tax=Ensete ventricosum TaxID=4639 RepID=A0A426YUF2_ENSVE|nr:hypothetical protein B296_00008171 [Ensete ventricosum]
MACRLKGIVECDKRLILIHERAMLVMEQVKVSQGNAFVTCLLEGPSGNGKTAMTATIGIEPDFSFVKFLTCCHICQNKLVPSSL